MGTRVRRNTDAPNHVLAPVPPRADKPLPQTSPDSECRVGSTTDAPLPAAEPGHFGLTRQDQFVSAVATTVMLLSLSLTQYRRMDIAGDAPLGRQQSRVTWRVDVNSAGWAEFTLLDRIGPVLARRIITDRQTNGPFLSVEDLQRVAGIGPRTIQRNRQRLTVSAPSPLQPRKSSTHAAE